MSEDRKEPVVDPGHRGRRRRRLLIGCGIATLLAIAIALYFVGPFLPLVGRYFESRQKRQYDPQACLANMRLLGEALKLYVESEGSMPPAADWMDRLSPFLRAADLSKEDQQKKLRCPDLGPTEYGYAFNGAIEMKSIDAISDIATTPAIYDSTKTSRNAADTEPFESLPREPREGGNNVLWADGHVSAAPSR